MASIFIQVLMGAIVFTTSVLVIVLVVNTFYRIFFVVDQRTSAILYEAAIERIPVEKLLDHDRKNLIILKDENLSYSPLEEFYGKYPQNSDAFLFFKNGKIYANVSGSIEEFDMHARVKIIISNKYSCFQCCSEKVRMPFLPRKNTYYLKACGIICNKMEMETVIRLLNK